MWRIAVLACLVVVVRGADWTYKGDHGPQHWGNDYPACKGEKQSPIDIKRDMAQFRADLRRFKFHGYDSMGGLELKLKNNGHAAQVDIVSGDVSISGGGLPEGYKLAQFHFHWGNDSRRGSEHTMDGHQYCMEVHFVHYADSRGTLGDAADKPQGLAVLGFFFEIGEHNDRFDVIVNNLQNVRNSGDEMMITPFMLKSMMPEHFHNYYRYSGSLTTPGCYESVIWTVFDDSIMVSEEQMRKFRSLMGSEGAIVNNFRPVQPMNDRVLFSNIDDSVTGGADGVSSVSIISMILAACLAQLFS